MNRPHFAMFPGQQQVKQLRQLLQRISFDEPTLRECAGVADLRQVAPEEQGAMLQRLDDGDSLGTVARLMLFGLPVDPSRLAAAIEPMTVAEWAAAGLVSQRNGRVHADKMLFPVEELVLLTDRPVHGEAVHAEDHVMAVGGGTKLLLATMIRRPCRRLVDLGTGCGVLGLTAARHSGQVLGVDLNPRAIAYARINAMLNGIDHAQFETKDFLHLRDEPDGASSFDRVLAQPSFVVVPEQRYVYRDAPGTDDEAIRGSLEVAASLLADHGFAQLVINWLHFRDEDGDARLERFLATSGCDGWVLRSRRDDPSAYAARWYQPAAPTASAAERQQGIERWIRFYEARGIEAISTGLVTLRKRPGARRWFHCTEAPERVVGTAAEQVLQIVAALDFLDDRTDQALLAAPLRVPAELRIDQRWMPGELGWQIEQCSSRLVDGLAYEVHHDAPIATLLQGCDGQTPLGTAIERVFAESGDPLDEVRARCLAIARMLLAHGVLLPPASRSSASES